MPRENKTQSGNVQNVGSHWYLEHLRIKSDLLGVPVFLIVKTRIPFLKQEQLLSLIKFVRNVQLLLLKLNLREKGFGSFV